MQLPGFKSEGGGKTWVFTEKSNWRHMHDSPLMHGLLAEIQSDHLMFQLPSNGVGNTVVGFPPHKHMVTSF